MTASDGDGHMELRPAWPLPKKCLRFVKIVSAVPMDGRPSPTGLRTANDNSKNHQTMIDTIKLRCWAELRHEVVWQINKDLRFSNDCWEIESRFPVNRGKDSAMKFTARCVLPNLKGYIHAQGQNNVLKNVTAGLPNVLLGSNGRMIKNELELFQALEQLRGLICSIVQPSNVFTGIDRLDLALNFPIDPRDVLNSYRGVKVFGLHGDSRTFQNGDATAFVSSPQTLEWRGSELHVCMYDKCTQMASASGSSVPESRCTRIEIRFLNKRRVSQFLGQEIDQMDSLTFEGLYQRYRQMLCSLPVGDIPGNGSVNDLIAAAAMQNGVLIAGVPISDFLKQNLHQASYRRRIKAIANIAARSINLNWTNLLPESGPPELAEVLGDGSLQSIFDPSWGRPCRIIRDVHGYRLEETSPEARPTALPTRFQ